MKKIILILIAFSFINSKSQNIDSIRISNVGLITTLDTVYLTIYTTNDNGGYLTSESYSVSGTNINVLVNTCSGPSLILGPLNVYVKINPLNVGNYKLKVALKDYDYFLSPGCNVLKHSTKDSVNINVVLPNAVEEKSNAINLIKVMPNPFKNNIKLNFSDVTEYKLSVLDNIGRIVYEKLNYTSNQELDLSFLTNGVYFLIAQNKSEQRLFKIIKAD